MRYYLDFFNHPANTNEKLEFFDRNLSEERRLDNELISLDVNVLLSLEFFCRRLEHLTLLYNDLKYERIKLLHFLGNRISNYLDNISKELPNEWYISQLINHIEKLREKINIKPYNIDIVDDAIDQIIAEIDAYNGDLLNSLFSGMFRNVHKYSFGYALSDRNVNFYVCDNPDKLYEMAPCAKLASRGCVIIINGSVDRNVLSKLFIHYLPRKIVTVSEGKWRKSLDSRAGFRREFIIIITFCERILNSKKQLDPEFRQFVNELNTWLLYTRNKIDRYFDNSYELRIKKRDFTALNITMKNFAHKMANVNSFYFNETAEKIERNLNDLGDMISYFFEQSKMVYELPETIFSGIRRIREDANLYRINTKNVFQENNLSAALNNWLNGRFVGHDLEARSEESIGNGRTDISIFYKSSRVAIIESKLISSHSDKNNIKQSIHSGFHQVFTKYSSFLNREILFPPRLYLVLFAFDADYKKIRDQIFSVLQDLQKEPGLSLVEGPKVSTTCYRYIASSLAGDSPGDEVFIDIILADLRVNDNLDQKHGRFR